MPEYFPAANISAAAALAEQANQMRSQQPSPWAALLQSFAPSVEKYGENRAKYLQGTATPQQVQAMGLKLSPVTQPLPKGQQGPPQTVPGASAFPGGRIPMTLVEQMQHNRELELLNKMTTQRALDVQGLKGQQAEVKDHTPATADMLKNYPKISKMGFQEGDLVPNRFISDQSKPAPQALNVRDSQFWEKQWVDTGKDMDTSKASSRTPLGVATTNNQKAGRAMKLLNSKGTFTPQDQSLVTTDLTAMMKGGSPDEELLRQQQYGNLYTDAVTLLQRVTSSPQDLNLPEVRQHLGDIVKGIVQVDNQVIQGHVENVESTRADVIAKRPKDWEKLKGKTLKYVLNDGWDADKKSSQGKDLSQMSDEDLRKAAGL